MNYIRHLTGFFERVCKDHRLNPTHISIYMAIFQFWNVNRFRNPLSISRSEIMELSKVSSRNTYHKCMKELHQFGYFRYDPSYHPLRGSWVYLHFFKSLKEEEPYKNGTGSGQVVDSQHTGDVQEEDGSSPETLAGIDVEPSLNVSKHIKLNKPISLAQERDLKEGMESDKNAGEKKKELSPQEKNEMPEKLATVSKSDPASPSSAESLVAGQHKALEKMPVSEGEVTSFFLDSGYPKAQALKFFHFYTSTGWKLGGKTPIENWRSAAHSWMLHAQNTFTHPNAPRNGTQEPSSKQLHARTDKNYSEPL